ncbi:MAG: 3-phosphoshikimate 1-carboxyvinyltransferase [Saprospirales bacterium]|nr:3-phosphoshikimate 1-carboxyvinyltransferase [Saprospirales bacterium]
MAYPPLHRIFQPHKQLHGSIALERSKSLSNRALIIRELCETPFDLHHLSTSSDTRTLADMLARFRAQGQNGDGLLLLDAGAGGTTFRFLTAFLAFQPGEQFLTGNDRIRERPVGPLVEALRRLGARIDYAGQEGFPPLRIGAPDWNAYQPRVAVSASVSSQFISALLLVGPRLPKGLHLQLEDAIVSKPYIEMTLAMMRHFGVDAHLKEQEIQVPPAAYRGHTLEVEADWSAASYFYAFAALSESCDLVLEGLRHNSWQGDAVLAKKMEAFGVQTKFEKKGVRLIKFANPKVPFLEWDFLPTPDLAQTISVLCAARGVHALFSGLETLRIKETDRIAALKQELQKTGVWLTALPERMSQRTRIAYFNQEGQAHWEEAPCFSTYGDHRMAMAFSMLAHLGPIWIEEPEVVEKSYPGFWEDLQKLGFEVG